jgi:hypothetical protein
MIGPEASWTAAAPDTHIICGWGVWLVGRTCHAFCAVATARLVQLDRHPAALVPAESGKRPSSYLRVADDRESDAWSVEAGKWRGTPHRRSIESWVERGVLGCFCWPLWLAVDGEERAMRLVRLGWLASALPTAEGVNPEQSGRTTSSRACWAWPFY